MFMRTLNLRWPVFCLAISLALFAKAADLTVTQQVLRPASEIAPLGANDWGRVGAVEWAANNFIHNSGNEPIYWKNLHRVTRCADNWFEIDGPGTSWYDLWGSGFLSGANVRIYRLVDKEGKSLPVINNYLDIDKADHPVLVGTTKIIPAGAPGYPDGGWVVGHYTDIHTQNSIRHGNLSTTDTRGLEAGRNYYYVVVAVSQDGQESDVSNEAPALVGAAAPQMPHIIIPNGDDKLPELTIGHPFDFTPMMQGGSAPLQWNAASLPQGLKIDPATGHITGQSSVALKDARFELHVKDSKGQEDVRLYVINPSPVAGDKTKPLPPTELTAKADGLAVTLTWKASPSANVAFYRLKRAILPRDKQVDRVYVVDGSPKLEPYDYIVLEKKFDPFDMNVVSSRVRGIGNPINSPSWYWNADSPDVSLQLVPHQQKLPAEMIDPGETCLEVTATQGHHFIKQIVFIGTNHGGESLWYGQLEPGKNYRAEFLLRQEGLADGGKVTFSYGIGYPDIHKDFAVTGEWQKYTHDFVGPERPKDPWHFGHQLDFTGPGKLDLDNCRIFRVDDPADVNKPYVPNATVFNEFMAAQPATGPKGTHRIWFLNHNATMSSILSWHGNSATSPDWVTQVGGTMEMTLPMALMFDERTGKTPQERVRPWLVIQHVLHSEQDWLNLVEYLSAPYDPAKDSPQSKPWAFRRYQQRGNNPTPWTDEFAQIIIEFGNETWHNGFFADWLGFAMRNQVTAGGREYGLFTRYLVENMKKSPYWASQNLDAKIRFDLGAFYNGNVEKDGKITGYGEDAMKKNPMATLLGHANYVGPKWETGQAAAKVYSDDGVQTTLLSFVQGLEPDMQRWSNARQAMAKPFHAYDLAAYEGGPSGYTLPGSAPADVVEVNEKYGKSLAMAVAALDAWLSGYKYGYTYQNFLGYGQGSYWNSHTDFADGFRPSPGWLALTLRNRYASGDMMAVETADVPTIKRGKGEYPLLGCYAMRDGKTWNVFVLSRQLNGALPATIQLPIATAKKITLHKLASDPRLTNRDKMNISIQSVDIDPSACAQGKLAIGPASGGVDGGIPAGSIYLYSIESN